MINSDRLADCFAELVRIDSISREEANIAAHLKDALEALGATVVFDDAARAVNGNCGNMIATIPGSVDIPPLLLSAHMDTVEPGRGIEPVLKDGVFTSAGDTILGSDDKSALAILLEVVTILKEKAIPHASLELAITVCEEIGLMGAKNLDFSLISAPYGYALDTRDTDAIVTRAPYANRMSFTVYGKDAHAGAKPENGINAISVASRAIAQLDLGRIDEETTCNIGLIQGGLATNIVPGVVEIHGEARSHDPAKLKTVTHKFVKAFEDAVAEEKAKNPGLDGLPKVEMEVEQDFAGIHVPEDHPVVTLAKQAAGNLGRTVETKMTGGGADANVFCSKGIITGVMGTGMDEVHSVREKVSVNDMTKCAELLLEIIRIHAQTPA